LRSPSSSTRRTTPLLEVQIRRVAQHSDQGLQHTSLDSRGCPNWRRERAYNSVMEESTTIRNKHNMACGAASIIHDLTRNPQMLPSVIGYSRDSSNPRISRVGAGMPPCFHDVPGICGGLLMGRNPPRLNGYSKGGTPSPPDAGYYREDLQLLGELIVMLINASISGLFADIQRPSGNDFDHP
jgi:hypothetical protein